MLFENILYAIESIFSSLAESLKILVDLGSAELSKPIYDAHTGYDRTG